MIQGFEKYLSEVKDSDISIINSIAKGLNARVGKHLAITNVEAREAMYLNLGVKISSSKFRKYIQYIRAYNLCPMLCASAKGYWISKDQEEFIKYRDGYASRIRAMEFTKACLFHFEIKNNIIK